MIYEEYLDGHLLKMQPSTYANELIVTLDSLIVATITKDASPTGRWQYRVREWDFDQIGDYGDMTLYTLEDVWRRELLYAKYDFLPHLK